MKKNQKKNNYNIYQILDGKIIREFHQKKQIIEYIKYFMGCELEDSYFDFVESDNELVFSDKYLYQEIPDDLVDTIVDTDYLLSLEFFECWNEGNTGIQRFANSIVAACENGTEYGGYHWKYII